MYLCVLYLLLCDMRYEWLEVFFFQAEDGIRDLVRSRGLGDVYKRQVRGLARGGEFLFPGQHVCDDGVEVVIDRRPVQRLSLIHI